MQRVNQTAATLLLTTACVLVCATVFATPKTYVQALGPDRAEVRVELDAASAVELTVNGTKVASPAAKMHALAVRGLAPRTRYTYSVAGIEGSFTTAPPDSSKEPFTALLYGDNRTDDEAHALVVKEMLRTPSDFLLHTGDFVSDSRQLPEWNRFFQIEQPLLRDRCVFAAIGNHDLIDDGEAYKRYFGTANFSVRWAFARFFIVNAMDDSLRTWLLRELAKYASEDVVWRVVVLHQGPYSSGPHGANEIIDDGVVDTWRTNKVDLVLSGHDHIYERGYARGIGYVVSGGGGAPPYKIDAVLPTSRKTESSRHFVEVRFATDDVVVTGHRADGTKIEERTFHQSRGWDEDVAGPKTTTGEAPKPAPAPEKKGTTPWVWAAPGGALLLLLIALGLRRYAGRDAPSKRHRRSSRRARTGMRDVS